MTQQAEQDVPFTVTHVETGYEPDHTGMPQRVVHVHYKTTGGVDDVHTHPGDTATPQAVANAITPKARNLDGIKLLGHHHTHKPVS